MTESGLDSLGNGLVQLGEDVGDQAASSQAYRHQQAEYLQLHFFPKQYRGKI